MNKRKQRTKRDKEREAKLEVVFSKKPKIREGLKTWLGNKGAYKITESAVDTQYHACVRKVRGDGAIWYDYVEEHVRFKTLITAMLACNSHYKDQKCPSTNTPAHAATNSKNSKTIRSILANVLPAESLTDSSGSLPKSESPRLEALLSRNTRGGSAKAEDTSIPFDSRPNPYGRIITEPIRVLPLPKSGQGPLTQSNLIKLADALHGSAFTIEGAMGVVGLSIDDFEPLEIESQLLNLNVERCQGCPYWYESGELIDDDHMPGFCYECRSHVR